MLIALVVFLLTRKNQWSYLSETTIYTGVNSGYSVQQQSSTNAIINMAIYDNLINLIRSRQTLEEVSVSLLAQHLLLNNYDSRYISKENFDDLRSKVPPEIMEIVRKYKRENKRSYRPGATSPPPSEEYEEQNDLSQNQSPETEQQQTVSGEKKYHVVKRGETVYSIAKSNGLSVNQLMNLNLLSSYDIEIGQKLALNNSHGKPKNTSGPFTSDNPEPSPVTDTLKIDTSSNYSSYFAGYDTLGIAPKIITDSTSFEKLVRRLLVYGRQNEFNFIYKLWNSVSDRYYSISALQAISVKRIQNSDLIQLSYKNPDPGICQQTLVFLTKIFIRNYKILKQNQTDAVIQYFKRQVQDATERLKKAENDLLVFNERNQIINYYEQTKIISVTKEELDVAYQNKQITLASSDAALKMIERKLETHANLSLNTSAILRLRGELGDATIQISNLEIDQQNDSGAINQLAAEKMRVERIKQEIKTNIDKLYIATNSVEGLPIKDVLNAWLNNVIIYEESKAALRVLTERRKHFQKLYEIFAPLGAEMKRIERLIGVTENEFLQLLHDLNLAKLRQQDDELSTNIKVVDPPYYPLNPIRSRSLLLVLVSGIFGFFLIVIILLALEFFDTSIKTPSRAEQIIKLKIAGIYPKISKQMYSVDVGFILPRLIEILTQNIKLALFENLKINGNRPILILIMSTRTSEGKTTMAREISRKLKSYGDSVLYLNPSQDFNSPYQSQPYSELIPASEDEVSYTVKENFFEAKGLQDILSDSEYLNTEGYNYIILEIPSLINSSYPLEFIQQFDIALMVTRANRSWTDADTSALQLFKSVFKQNTLLILNGIDVIYLDVIFGEIPKFRSKFYRTMKRILLFQFKDTNSV
ncbi:MAG: LysM peptidoglycan-binding domain-containing protein [Bacteroidales bacterium]|nr:LysM peptidoglycan-binding domain-containing protein [Bacteroidales bacterium]